MTNSRTFFLRLLGSPLVTRDDGTPIVLQTQKSLALLAMVATSDTGLRRETVAATIWSRSSESQARASLRQALSKIKAALGADVILAGSGVLSLNRNLVASDLDALDQPWADAGQDLAQFGGVFLDGISISEPPFEDWLATRRAAFAAAVQDGLLAAGASELEAGNAAQAQKIADRLLELDGYDEAAMALCLKACAAGGQRSRVQIRFDAFEKRLKTELGIDMGAELVALKAALLRSGSEPPARRKKSSIPAVLVVPFTTLSDAPEHRFFAEGLAEDVTAHLSKFSTLSVVARQSHVPPDGAHTLASYAADLGADYYLTGTVRWLGDQFRLSAELVDVSSGSIKWAERLDRQTPNLFDLQDDVSRHLSGAIPYRIEDDVAERARKSAPEALEAYELMILGKRLRDTIALEGNLEARALLEQAVTKDAALARAHMYLSDSYVVQHWLGQLDEEGRDKVLFHARRAAELDPLDVHIQDHLGFALHARGHWDASMAQIRHALSLAENEIESMSWCGYALLMLGEHEEAADILNAVARRRTTLPPTFEWIMGQLLSFQGKDEAVVRTLNGAALLNSIGLAFRAGSQARLGMLEEAKFTLAEFQAARLREQRLSGIPADAHRIETALGGYRALWRRSEDWAHIAQGLRLAGMPD